jgi:endo-1,4-beta-xylanase
MMTTRRNVLALLASAIGANAAAIHAKEPRRPALRELAAAKGLILGSAMSGEQLESDERAFFAREVASITPENALKMTAIRPARDAWHFERADALVDFAAEAGLAVRGHALVWNNDRQPAWLGSLSAAEMRGVMQEHIERTMSRYDGRIAVWDVINEPVGDVAYGPYSLREGPFLARLGPQYVAESFRMARAAAPAAKLVLNETHTERDDRFGRGYRQSLLFLIDRLQDAGVPIDGIGLQGHLQPDVHFDLDAFLGFLAEIERRKLFIEITELDINDDSFPADEAVRDAAVGEAYRRYLGRVLANKAVRSLTFWQLGDAASWYNSASVHNTAASSRRPRPLLFDASMRPKPALFAVIAALQAMPTRVSSK